MTKLTKVFNGYENTDPNFCYIDKNNKVYYGHTKEPNICDQCNKIQLEMNTDHEYYMVFCPNCDIDPIDRELFNKGEYKKIDN